VSPASGWDSTVSSHNSKIESDFENLLINEGFSPELYETYPPEFCATWIGGKENKIRNILLIFRSGRDHLIETLEEIGDALKKVFLILDRLCDGPCSYLALLPAVKQREGMAKYYEEFITAYDEIWDVLREYKLYAKAYEESSSKNQQLIIKPPNRDETAIRTDLVGKFETLLTAARNMAESIAALPAPRFVPGPVPGRRQTG
jgi:hypothetical protein